MSDRAFVGTRVAELKLNLTFDPITRVTINKGDDAYVTTGNDTGRTLEIDCPWGTYTMAANILSVLRDYVYQPYDATDAKLDPAAEIGDGVSIGGIYSVIASQNIHFDGLTLSDLSAPEDEDLNHEYPYLPPIERKVQHAQSTANEAVTIAESAATDAEEANTTIQAWKYPGTSVKIDGAMIQAGTVMASELLGGVVGMLNQNEQQVGTMTISGASSGTYRIELTSGGALYLAAESGYVFIESSSGADIQIGTDVGVMGNLRPRSNGVYDLGLSSMKWNDIYAVNGTIQTSDREEKENINYDLSRYEALFNALKPVTFTFKDGKSGRTHIGFIAQDIENALKSCGLTSGDLAAFIKTSNVDGGYTYGLRYSELIALNTYKIQRLENRIAELEKRLEVIENG